MLFINDIFHQNNLNLALWQETNADISRAYSHGQIRVDTFIFYYLLSINLSSLYFLQNRLIQFCELKVLQITSIESCLQFDNITVILDKKGKISGVREAKHNIKN